METEKEDRKTDCSLTKVINQKPCSCFALHGFLISTFAELLRNCHKLELERTAFLQKLIYRPVFMEGIQIDEGIHSMMDGKLDDREQRKQITVGKRSIDG